MLIANCLTICAAGAILIAMLTGTLALCVLGLCLTGLSYGSCSTTTATFPAVFYGMKHYPTNVAYMTFNLMGGSLVATPVQPATDRHRRLCGALPPPSGLDGGGLGPEFGRSGSRDAPVSVLPGRYQWTKD